MKTKNETINISKKDLSKLHRDYLGASETPVLFGAGYITYQQLIEKKIYGNLDPPSLRMELGLHLEDFIFSKIQPQCEGATRNDYKIAYVDKGCRLIAIPDFISADKNYIGEIKTTSNQTIHSPMYHYQVQQQLMLSGADYGYLCLLNLVTGTLAVDIIYPDEAIQEAIRAKAKQFWRDVATGQIAASPESSENTGQTSIVANDEMVQIYEEYKALKKQADEIKEKMDNYRERLITYANGATIMLDTAGKKILQEIITEKESIDKTALKLALGGRYKEFAKNQIVKSYRIF